MDSLVLQTALGLVFIFATGAAITSVLTESVSRYIGLRSEYLLRGLRTLLDGGGDFRLPLREAITGRLTRDRQKESAAPPQSASSAAVAATARAQEVADARLQQARTAAQDAQGSPTEHETARSAASAAQVAQAAAEATASVGSAERLLDTPGSDRKRALVAEVMAHPLVGVTARSGERLDNAGDSPLRNRQRRRLPSYVSSRSFARALIDILVPNANGQTTMTSVRTSIATANLPPELRTALLAMADETTVDIAEFRANLEHWYDDQMARVSGWYKRHIRWVSLGIGVVIVLAFNLNVLSIARSIYTDEAVRGSVVTQASQASKCDKGPAACLQELRTNIADARGAGLPIGWTKVASCAHARSGCNWFEQRGLWAHNGRGWRIQTAELGLLLLGWGLMVLALLPGANFWFDILARLGTLRTTGPKPKTT